ncbi:MAG: DUF4347 domain-containing protein, partial [Gammaproteobacteria bacterium]|nr:DUF4347 domain-containing protein [Gammaproteobacteria bacterium]
MAANPKLQATTMIRSAEPKAIANSIEPTSERELIVADGLCPQIAELLPGARHEMVVLGKHQNPLEIITQVLGYRKLAGSPVQVLHIVAHGRPGAFQVGGNWINQSILNRSAASIAQWNVDTIAIWSCGVGADRDFIAQLGELSGANIACTSDIIEGKREKSWKINRPTGRATSFQTVFDIRRLKAWQGSLAGFTDVDGVGLDFSVGTGDQRISGSANTAGETWLYRNVITVGSQTIDAIVKFDSITGGSMLAFDSTSNPYNRTLGGRSTNTFLQPNFNWGGAANSASFTVSFIEGGSYNSSSNPSGTAATLRNVLINSYDLDASSDSNGLQYTSFTNVGGIELSSSTNLATKNDESTTTFSATGRPGNIISVPGTEIADDYRVRAIFDEASKISYTVGAGNGGEVAYYALDFSLGPTFNNVVTYDILKGEGTVVTSEARTTDSFTLRLASAPSADVQVTLTGLDTTEASLSASDLTFTTTNWNTPQTITVTGIPDRAIDGDITYTLTGTASSSDARY